MIIPEKEAIPKIKRILFQCLLSLNQMDPKKNKKKPQIKQRPKLFDNSIFLSFLIMQLLVMFKEINWIGTLA